MKLVVIAVALALLLPVSAPAWDSGAHELIALMACDRLNPKARAAIDEMAREMSVPGKTYDAVSLACWMDDLRKDTELPDYGKFFSWHYIDISLEDRDPVPSLEPGDDTEAHGNAVQALKRAMAVLRGGTDPYVTSKPMACAMVMHLVGDIHQPLHCATKYFYSFGQLRNDAGGNKELVINGPPGDARFNLHAFWDSAWRATFYQPGGYVVLDGRMEQDVMHDPALLRSLADQLKKSPPPTGTDLEPHFDQWARESNAIARNFVYPELTVTESKKYCRLSSEYVARANQIASQRLVLAAWRLANVLNETLGQ